MFEAIMNLLLVALGIGLTALWIAALCESDGDCHMDNCAACPFDGDCPAERKKHNEDS